MSKGQTKQLSFCGDNGKSAAGQRIHARRFAPITAAAVILLLAAPSACRIADAQTADSYAAGADAAAKGPIIDLDVVNASLLTVVQALKLQSRAQIVVVNSRHYQPVTLTVTSSLGDALNYVAQSAGAIVTRDANGVYTFRAVSDPNFGAGAISPMQASYMPQSAPAAPQMVMHNERIALQFVDPNYVLAMLNDSPGIRELDPVAHPRSRNLVQTYDAPYVTSGSGISEANPYTATNTGAQQPGVPLANGGYSGAATHANRISDNPGSQAGQFAPGFNPGFGGPNQVINPGGNTVNPFPNPAESQLNFGGNGQNGQNGQNNQANSLRPQGIDSITSNEEDNSLIVRGTPEGITELKQIIGFLDRAPRQVQIKVEYITTDVTSADQFGINWEFIPASNIATGFNGGGAATGAVGSSYLTFAQGNAAAQLQATLTNGKSKVVSAPIITTTNNTTAFVDFGTVVPYQQTGTVAQGSGNAISSTTVSYLQVPDSLTITPRINGDDSVSLLLNPQIGEITAAGSATLPPTVQSQTVSTYRTVANGETMVIGGLVTKTVTNQTSEIPFLGELPIIGNLFRTKNNSISDNELLIFVTPTILPPIGSGLAQTPSEAGVAASGDSTAGVGVSP